MIYTFYSFKGGVGRSMALANVAELLYRHGANVLMVDFDLEAPGLEGYFNLPEAVYRPGDIQGKRGVIDLLHSYKEMRSLSPLSLPTTSDVEGQESAKTFPYSVEPLTSFVVPIYQKGAKGGSLSIMPAGTRQGDKFTNYAQRVRCFDWDDFYANWDGEQFFEWFRCEAESIADYVLIDSRTGVTEMGGVCTYQLADVVIMFVSPNQQSLDGTLMIARSLSNPKLIEEGRNGRELSLVFVPSRVEQGEAKLLDEFAWQFDKAFANFTAPQLIFEKSAFIDLKIPYVPYYAYMENVAVREPDRASASDLIEAFERLVGALSQLRTKDKLLTGTEVNLLQQSEIESADKLYNQASIWREDRKGEAFEYAEKAIKIWEKLAETDLKMYGLKLAKGKKLLSQLVEESDEQRSIAESIAAKRIYHDLYKIAPNSFGKDVAAGLAELAYYFYDKDTKEAIRTLHEATEISTSMAGLQTERLEGELARWLYDLSNWYIEEEQFSEGLEAIQEAVPIYRRLLEADNEQFESDLADSLITLSECSLETGDMSGAIASGHEAVEIYKHLFRVTPKRHEAGLVKSFNALLDILSRADISSVPTGLASVQEAVSLFRSLADRDPRRYEPDLAKSLNMLPEPLTKDGHWEEALKSQQEAIEIFRNIKSTNPAQYEPELALSLVSLSKLLFHRHDIQRAQAAALEAVDILERLSKDSPSRYKEDLKEAIGLANQQSSI